MRKPGIWGLASAVLAVVLLLSISGGPALATVSRTQAALPERSAAEVLLPTGDQVRVRGQAWAARPAFSTGPGRELITRTRAGRRYLVPVVALRYLGSVLDYSLFDVAQLARTQTASGRVLVRLSYQGAVPTVPGVTITSASAGVASGYLTPASAKNFGRALVRQWEADSAAGWPRRATMFGGLRKISAADPAQAPARVRPQYPQYSVIVKVTGPDGRPEADGQVQLVNMDNQFTFDETTEVVNGEARFSAPKGNYTAIAIDYVIDPDGTDHMRISTVADYSVKGAGQTLAIDHRKAAVLAAPTVPQPAELQGFTFTEQRVGKDGRALVTAIQSAPFDLRYNPAGRAAVGSLNTFHQWVLAGGSGSSAYTYDLAASGVGVPAKKVYAFTTKDLATVKSRYYGDGVSHRSYFTRYAQYGNEDGLSVNAYPLPVTLGTARTEYVGATGDPTWVDELTLEQTVDTDFPFLDSAERRLAAGSVRSQSWARGPIAPGFPLQDQHDALCLACRSTNSMYIEFPDMTDSDPQHMGYGLPPEDGLPYNRFRVYANGHKIVDRSDIELTGDTVTVPTKTTKFRVRYDLDRRKAEPAQSISSRTELTFTSKAGAGKKPPSVWTCFADGACHVLPIVRARLSLPTDLQGRLPVGKSTVTVTVSGLQGAGKTVPKSASLQIHAADRGIWLPVKLTSVGGGVFRGTITNTEEYLGQGVDVKFGGTNAAGSTFTQTVLRAYTVAGA